MPDQAQTPLEDYLTRQPGLQELLAGLGGGVSGEPQHWSLGDVDRLLAETFGDRELQETGDRRQEAGERQEAGDRRQEAGERQEAGDRRQEAGEWQEEPEAPPAPGAILTPEEVCGPAPEPDSMRFDLFQPQDQTRRVPPVARTIERPGVVLRRVDIQMTTDLSPVPRVVPADEFLRRAAPDGAFPEGEDVPEGQQRLPGFEEEAARKLSEEELRKQLEKSRAERTSQFRSLRSLAEQMEAHGDTGDVSALGAAIRQAQLPETGGGKGAKEKGAGKAAEEELPQVEPTKLLGVEYRDPAERDQLFRTLRQTRGRRATTTALLGGLTIGAAVLQVLPLFFADPEPTRLSFLFGQAMLLLAGLFLSGGDLLRGTKALLRRAPNSESMLLLAGVASAAQAAVLLARGKETAALPCAALFLFQAAAHSAARLLQAGQICGNFRFVAYTNKERLYAVRLIEESAAGQGETAVPVPVRMPGHFMRESMRETAVDQICSWLLPLSVGLAAVAGVSAGVVGKSAVAGLSAAALALCFSMPAMGLLTLMGLLASHQKGQRENGVAILNTDAAEACAGASAFALDSADLFLPGGRMHGWREYWQVRTDEVLLYAAAVAIASGGPLQAVFEGVVEGDYAVLPDVHELTYEDRMGLTCWIHNQRVFFGNRKLLENHGITVALRERDERAYEHDGRRIIYLAVEKRLTAFFVVSYKPDASLEQPFQALEKADIWGRICNSDPVVTAENLNAAFGVKQTAVLRAKATDLLRGYMRTPRKSEPAGVYHTNTARAFLRAVTACVALKAGVRRLRAFQLIGVLTAFLLLLVFAATNQMDAANSLIFIGFELIWTAITYTAIRS
ncbi:MAG: hypothetical protein LBG83_09360 [Oscillospiraceae bacterium]|nr:hypothetical protein [Oscillospiraceae bacterium]